MIKLDQEIATHIDQAFMPEGNVCWIAIAREPGEQDLGPKGSTMVFDDQCLVYRERVRRPTLVHLEENPNGVLVYRNAEERLQRRFYGVTTVYRDGPIRDQVMAKTIPQELERDLERKGVGMIIRVEKLMTFAGQVVQERDR